MNATMGRAPCPLCGEFHVGSWPGQCQGAPKTHEVRTIEVPERLETTEFLRKMVEHPGMYVGDTTTSQGVHHLLFWIFDDALDNARAGKGTTLQVVIEDDGTCVVAHDSPLLRPGEDSVPARLDRATSRVWEDAPDRGLGVHGHVATYLPLLRALSSKLEIDVGEDGTRYVRTYTGKTTPANVLVEVRPDERPGWSLLRFLPDPTIFSHCTFDPQIVRGRFREMAAVHPGYRLQLAVGAYQPFETFETTRGMAELLDNSKDFHELIDERGAIHPDIFHLSVREGPFALDVAVKWRYKGHQEIVSWANSILMNKGMHEIGAAQALRDAGADGSYTCYLSVFLPAPRFSTPTKRRLDNPEIGDFVRSHMAPALRRFLARNPRLAVSVAYSEVE